MRYAVWIDRGVTFTDCILQDRQAPQDAQGGGIRVTKVLSSDRAPIEGIRKLLDLREDQAIPPCDIRMGTTLATNALLERRGARTVLVITKGFADALAIGDQSRPALFDLAIRRPAVLYGAVVETEARVADNGVTMPHPARLRAGLSALRRQGFESVAVAVLRGHQRPDVEEEIGAIARDVGFEEVSLSSAASAEVGLVGRGDTAVADAYLTPLLRNYVAELVAELPGSRLQAMQSSGALTDASGFRGRNAVLSGPAGGIVAIAHIARLAGEGQVIGFDMGGTSTDVSRVAGDPERAYETRVAGVRLRTPMLRVHTIAAGGGSLCRVRGGRLTVGPESAGAEPGPLCYGRPEAHELSLTDVHLALGRVLPHRFPFALDRGAALAPLEAIAKDLGGSATALTVAAGFFEVAVEAMASAIRTVTVGRGHDAREHALVVFGGAGGQAACAVARRLGIRRLIFHPLAGVLSAYGMGVAPTGWHGEEDVGDLPLTDRLASVVEEAFAALEAAGREALAAQGYDGGRDPQDPQDPQEPVRVERRVDLRYRGTESVLSIEARAAATGRDLRRRFDEAHRREFGYVREAHPVEVTTARVSVSSVVTPVAVAVPTAGPAPDALPASAPVCLPGHAKPAPVPVIARESLAPGDRRSGPVLVVEATGTIVVEEGFDLEVLASGIICLEARRELPQALDSAAPTDVDPVRLEVMANRFAAIAEQMGEVLRRTALSTNIRDRLDYSCAVFDSEGGLIANAPHIPVHLGAMGESVRAVAAAHPEPSPGDVFVTNDPAAGGSHLPDLTVVTPVHGPDGDLRFYTANRGHHADIGGITPGSMPAFSSSLAEEGVRFRAERVVRGGRLRGEWFLARLREGPYPARRPEDNLADLEGQIAANQKGAALLSELADERGADFVAAYMGHVQDNAAAQVAAALSELPDGTERFEDALDDGTPIVATVTVRGASVEIDFEGTGPALPTNLNAPRAVTIAAVLYSLRCLVAAPIPLNAGCLRPVSIRIPRGSVLDPPAEAPVAGGNVETSQRIVDVLLGALDRAAASQGTMNNLTFGNDSFGYYETLGGGAGAGPGFPGASGVHTHMTNSRITDPEILETRYPVRVLEFSIRRGSGGAGRWRGGDGLVREFEALAPLTVSVLSQRRLRRPFGLGGGEAGAAGRNLINGEDVGPIAERHVEAGQTFRIETPGGGGYGTPET
ncbi:MAG: hydantoinase B/oxoprolinase family protein [Deltaproteobacteria bacterium]|nr:hydantoinase B/oxoprolinase family protein [Deltaproteobacteria bacterium]